MLFRSAALGVLAAIVLSGVAQAQASEPKDVVEAFELARGAGDIDSAMAQFADDAVVTVLGRTTSSYSGKDQVRMYMETLGVRFQTLMRSSKLVQGNSVTWTERDVFPNQSMDSTVIAIVSSGRISTLIYRSNDPFGLAAGAAAAEQPRELPSATWPAALALLGVAVLAIVFGRPRRASQSQLDGRLLFELRQKRSQAVALDHQKRAA